MKREIDFEHAQFTNEFKMNEKFNLNKFLGQKAKLRKQTGTEAIEEEISEQIAESMVFTDNKTESYIRSQIITSSLGEPKNQNLFPV